jgi:hypothetical protein
LLFPGARIVPNPQRVASQQRLVVKPHAQSWRFRCELGQLALHYKRIARTFCLRTVSRCTRLSRLHGNYHFFPAADWSLSFPRT